MQNAKCKGGFEDEAAGNRLSRAGVVYKVVGVWLDV